MAATGKVASRRVQARTRRRARRSIAALGSAGVGFRRLWLEALLQVGNISRQRSQLLESQGKGFAASGFTTQNWTNSSRCTWLIPALVAMRTACGYGSANEA